MDRKFMYMPLEIKGSVDDAGVFVGYGSTFLGEPDSHSDVILPGAFAKTLAAGGRNLSGVALLWSHKSDEPIGIFTELREDSRGLKVTGKLALETPGGRKAYELLKIGAVKHMSIGYEPVDWEHDKKKKIRYLKEISLWEISLCVFPSNRNATIIGVKECKSEGNLIDALRNLGLSESDALFVPGLCKTCKKLGGLPALQVKEIAGFLSKYSQDIVGDAVAVCEQYTCGKTAVSESGWSDIDAAVKRLVSETALLEKEARDNLEELKQIVTSKVDAGASGFEEVYRIIDRANLALSSTKSLVLDNIITPDLKQQIRDVEERVTHITEKARKIYSVSSSLGEEEPRRKPLTALEAYEKYGIFKAEFDEGENSDLDYIKLGDGSGGGVSSFSQIGN